MAERPHDELPLGTVVDSPIEEEMKRAYIDYAMSVIVGRALPDARDGLKPVHRRVLYAMLERGWRHDRPFVKSAKIVGEVIGNYHPHGDLAVYDTLVRMVQDFSLREPLAQGQGNFGSVDGDNAAAYRYTEARLSPLAEELLADIDKDTVDFVPNFDATRKEPVVLPAAFPNLLVNGANGIAVGMATNIPPHNLAEVIDAAIHLIDHPEARVADLMRFVKAPDFPTGGIIHGLTGVREAYETGKGRIVLRGRVGVEQTRSGKELIVITEIPYQVNKAALVESIAALVRDRKIDGVTALRDESDRKGMRIVLELRKGAETQLIINQLYKHTQLQESVGVTMLALVGGLPKVLNLKEALQVYIDHRKEVVTRRTRFDLRKAEERLHILEGLLVALAHIDEVIRLIRTSPSVEEARRGLMERFGLSQTQADAILDMKLQKLTGLETEKLRREHEETKALIADLRAILDSPARLAEVVKTELAAVRDRYRSPRRTDIAAEEVQDFTVEDIVADEDIVITVSHLGYVKRHPVDTYRRQRRGGKGVTSTKVRDEDFVSRILVASTHDHILFLTDRGKVFHLKGYEIPQESKMSRGRPLRSLLNLAPNEAVAAVVAVRRFEDDLSLAMITARGLIKKTRVAEFANAKRKGVTAIALRADDRLIDVVPVTADTEAFIASRNGQGLRTHLGRVRDMGRSAGGVKGLTLEEGDRVIGMTPVLPGTRLFVLTERGYGKRVDFGLFATKGRGGKGNRYLKVTDKVGPAVAVRSVSDEDELMAVTEQGTMIRIEAAAVPVLGRDTQGVRVISVDETDRVRDVGVVSSDED